MRVCVLGSINTDLVATCDHLPKPGETRTGDDFRVTPGGKGANQAVAAARMGADVTMIGAVGDDDHGRRSLEHLGACCDVSGVRTVDGVPSGVALICVDHAGENTIVVVPGANAHVTLDDHARQVIADADVLLVQLELPLDVVREGLDHARTRAVATILNPAPAHPDARALRDLVDCLVMNETEASIIGEGGAPTEIVTLGARGARWRTPEADGTIEAFEVDAIDTVGAGDAFCGALAACLAEPDRLRLASACAALATTRHGASVAIPERHEVDRFLETR